MGAELDPVGHDQGQDSEYGRAESTDALPARARRQGVVHVRASFGFRRHAGSGSAARGVIWSGTGFVSAPDA
jgi:hypothetical protein